MKAPKIWKIPVLGDVNVGKTSLVTRFAYNTFSEEKENSVESKAYKRKLEDILLMVWDVSVYEEHVDKILNGSKAVVIMGDITRGETLTTMYELAKFLEGHKAMLLFVGNKSDMKYQAEFWKDELAELAMEYDSPYFFTSAKTGEHVEDVFKYVIEHA